jgi:hypothetical protein
MINQGYLEVPVFEQVRDLFDHQSTHFSQNNGSLKFRSISV